jgi:hypothetical protein
MVDPQVEEETSLIDEEHELFELLKRKQKITEDAKKKKITDETITCDFEGNFATLIHYVKGTTHVLASKSHTRLLEWIIGSGASRHMTGTSSEFTSYTHLTSLEIIQIVDRTSQPMVG